MSASTPQPAASAGAAVVGTPRTLRDMLVDIATKYPSNRALVSTYQSPQLFPSSAPITASINGDGPPTNESYLTWTYSHLSELSTRLAHILKTQYRVRAGTRIALFLPNCAEWVLLFWAAVKLGAVVVPLDARAVGREEEVAHYLQVVKPDAVVIWDTEAASQIKPLEGVSLPIVLGREHVEGWVSLGQLIDIDVDSRGHLYQRKDPYGTEHKPIDNGSVTAPVNGAMAGSETLLSNEQPVGNDNGTARTDDKIQSISGDDRLGSDINIESPLYIIFTSGTSGLPKACPWTNKTLWASFMAAEPLGIRNPSSVILQCAPPSHAMGISNMINAWLYGAAVVMTSASFDAKATLQAIEEVHCTRMAAVPTMLQALFRQPNYRPEKMRSLEQLGFGGTIIAPSVVAMAKDPKILGVPSVSLGFGMSEGLPICGGSVEGEMNTYRGALGQGRVLPGAKVRICRGGSRDIVSRGEVGELHFGGNMVIAGYAFGDNEPFYDDDEGHWIATGDQAMMDNDGVIFILGRYKDIIIRGGGNLSPALIESCIGQHGVLGQVVGIPDDIAGELPLAVLQVPNQEQIPREKINSLITEKLGLACLPTAYMTLEEIGLTSFPLTTSGKVRKAELRDKVIEHLSKLSSSSIQQVSGIDNDQKIDDIASKISLLVMTLANLTGQTENMIPLHQPLHTVIDSINILRFQASIQKVTSKTVSLDDLLSSLSISDLATRLDRTPTAAAITVQSQSRQGPPTATDMVHTHGNLGCATRTKAVAEVLLAKHRMSWADVEDILPIPDLSSRAFEAMRPMAFSVRTRTLFDSCSPTLLRNALDTMLQRWSMFRSFAMRLDNVPLFIIVRQSKAMAQAAIVMLPETERIDNSKKLRVSEKENNNVHFSSGGPLARFEITSVKDANSTCLMMLAHHSIFDAISLPAFMRDLASNLSNTKITDPYTNYKLFADTFYLHSTSTHAHDSIAYHVNRLRGISTRSSSPWPPQRSPGWFIGDDTGHCIPSTPQTSILHPRTQLSPPSDPTTTIHSIRKTTTIPSLHSLRSTRSISAPTLFKAACALLNTRHSPNPTHEAFFASTQAGRQWPFLSPSLATYLPNPFTIAGNTLALVMNRIHTPPSETVGSFLTRLEEEQRRLTLHAHAPTAAITAQLHTADATAFHNGRRQLLNCNPGLAEMAANEGKTRGRLLKIEGFTEVMLEWHCGVVAGNTALLVAEWDGAQFEEGVVEGWAGEFAGALRWLGEEGKWERGIREVGWEE